MRDEWLPAGSPPHLLTEPPPHLPVEPPPHLLVEPPPHLLVEPRRRAPASRRASKPQAPQQCPQSRTVSWSPTSSPRQWFRYGTGSSLARAYSTSKRRPGLPLARAYSTSKRRPARPSRTPTQPGEGAGHSTRVHEVAPKRFSPGGFHHRWGPAPLRCSTTTAGHWRRRRRTGRSGRVGPHASWAPVRRSRPLCPPAWSPE